jgi:hypothetical protein
VWAQWGVYPKVILVIPGIAQVSKPTAFPCQRIRRFRFDPGANLSPTTSPPARPSQPATPWPNRKLHEASCIIRGRRAPSLPKSLNTARHALHSSARLVIAIRAESASSSKILAGFGLAGEEADCAEAETASRTIRKACFMWPENSLSETRKQNSGVDRTSNLAGGDCPPPCQFRFPCVSRRTCKSTGQDHAGQFFVSHRENQIHFP